MWHGMGSFSSDRTIREYAVDTWGMGSFSERSAMLNKAEVLALCHANTVTCSPLSACMCRHQGRLWRTMQPGARAVFAIDADTGEVLIELAQRKIEALGESSGFFEASILGRNPQLNYRLRIVWPGGVQEIDDPYRFSTVLGELDVWLSRKARILRPFERLGAHLRARSMASRDRLRRLGPRCATRVSVIGDFNIWDARRHPMRLRRECGV